MNLGLCYWTLKRTIEDTIHKGKKCIFRRAYFRGLLLEVYT